MCVKRQVIVILLLVDCVLSKKNYFCDLPCRRACRKTEMCVLQNTACQRAPCKPNPKCIDQFKMTPINEKYQQYILDIHNDYRNGIAIGNDTRGGNSKAANMRAISWSKELAFVAQCWANNCRMDGPHDKCRASSKYKYCGQNVHSAGDSENVSFESDYWVEQAFYCFYEDEIPLMDASIIDEFHHVPQKIGHFTQVVWATTSEVGCGRVRFYAEDMFQYVIVCNYGEGGNIIGKPVYKRGDPCTACGSETCNSKYPGLCGKVRALSEDTWKPPYQLISKASKLESIWNVAVPALFLLLILM